MQLQAEKPGELATLNGPKWAYCLLESRAE